MIIGGFKNMNADKIIQCILVTMLQLEKAVHDAINNLGLPEQLDFEANGIDNFIDIGTTAKVKSFFYESTLQEKKYWSQTGSVITFTFTPVAATPGTSNLQFI